MRNSLTLSPLQKTVIGAQFLFVAFGATVLVPLLVGLDPSVALFTAGVGTLIFHICAKLKVPAFLGSSFAFLGGFQAISELNVGKFATMSGEEKLPYALGGIVIAGAMYIVLALLFKLVGAKKVMRFFPPIVTGPVIIAIGLTLAGTAIDSCTSNWLVALTAILVVVICNIWGKGMIKIVPILLGVLVSYIVAAVTGNVDFTAVKDAAWIGLPVKMENTVFSLFGKADGSLLISAIIAIMPIAFATMIEHIGDICAISSTVYLARDLSGVSLSIV